MAKSARASITKRNNQRLKKKVFGPVESARNERLNAKLLELASQPKPPRSEMEIEEEGALLAKKAALAPLFQTKNIAGAKKPAGKEDVDHDVDMDADETTQRATRSHSAQKKSKIAKAARVEKKRHRKARNKVVFPAHPKKPKKR